MDTMKSENSTMNALICTLRNRIKELEYQIKNRMSIILTNSEFEKWILKINHS